MADKTGPAMFAALTYDEMDILRSSLDSAATKLSKGVGDYAAASEITGLWWDVADEHRARWNAEHPDHQYDSHRSAA